MKYIAIILLVLTICSCSNDDLNFNEEYNSVRTNYAGQWQVELNRKEFIKDTLANENDYTFDLNLNEDGSGSQESLLFFDNDSINWHFALYPEKFTILTSRIANDPTFSGPYNRNIFLVQERTPDYLRMTSENIKISLNGNDTSLIVQDRVHKRIQ